MRFHSITYNEAVEIAKLPLDEFRQKMSTLEIVDCQYVEMVIQTTYKSQLPQLIRDKRAEEKKDLKEIQRKILNLPPNKLLK